MRLRIGVNTRPVVVGRIGDNLRTDYTAQGDTTNPAARLQALAEPSTILVNEQTYRLTHGYFPFQSLGARQRSVPLLSSGLERVLPFKLSHETRSP